MLSSRRCTGLHILDFRAQTVVGRVSRVARPAAGLAEVQLGRRPGDLAAEARHVAAGLELLVGRRADPAVDDVVDAQARGTRVEARAVLGRAGCLSISTQRKSRLRSRSLT